MQSLTLDIEIPVKISGDSAQLDCYVMKNIKQNPGYKREAIVVVPGGAYEWVSEREGFPAALAFLGKGIQSFVLRYSVAPNSYPVQILQLAKAVKVIHDRADEWNIDKDKIIILGFSAGGHLAGMFGAYWNSPLITEPLGLNKDDIRPYALLLGYPVVTMGPLTHQLTHDIITGGNKDLEDQLSIEKHVTNEFPPTFIWTTRTDGIVDPKNSLMLYEALMEHGVPSELHVFPVGVHGMSTSQPDFSEPSGIKVEPSVQCWIELGYKFVKSVDRYRIWEAVDE